MSGAHNVIAKWENVAAGTITSMQWSPDSECLALVISSGKAGTSDNNSPPDSDPVCNMNGTNEVRCKGNVGLS